MKCKILFMLAAATLGWAVTANPAETPKPATVEGPKKLITLPLKPATRSVDPKSAIARWQWVGFSESGICPPVTGWKEENLLSRVLVSEDYDRDRSKQALREEAADLAELHRLKLDRICIYEATTSNLDFPRPDELKAAEPDRMAVSPAGPESSNGLIGMENWPRLAQLFMTHTGTAPLGLRRDKQSRVRLVFLDTQPDGEGVPETAGSSRHGYTMAHLARRLVCSDGDGGPCAAEIATRLALPYKKFLPNERPPRVGGNLGLLTDLTAAILREVWEWRRPGSPEHLVLNLSLGWDGEMFGDLDARRVSQLEPSVKAVYNALRFASNRGALVIAAAGNRRGGPQRSDWPLLPAAWELRRPSLLPFGLGRKPVYAVGGVEWQGLPLSNFRHGGRPRRVAYGDQAVAGIANGGQEQPTMIYTGTSVSAAVTSAIAAVVWHLRPELTPAQVMRLIQRSGHPLPSRADFYPWRKFWPLSLMPAPPMRQVSLCKAVEHSCRGGRCPDLGAPSLCQNGAPNTSQLPRETTPPLIGVTPEARVETSLPQLVPPCDPSTWFLVPGGAPLRAPCPIEQYSSRASQRWTGPQPEDPPCPGCPLKASSVMSSTNTIYTLGWKLSEEWQNAIDPTQEDPLKIQSATLAIECFAAGSLVESRTYPLTDAQIGLLNGTATISFPGNGSLTGCTARLNIEITSSGGSESFLNPLAVSP